MFTTEPGRDRYKLGFEQAVLKNSKFLAVYMMNPVRREPTFVCYDVGERKVAT